MNIQYKQIQGGEKAYQVLFNDELVGHVLCYARGYWFFYALGGRSYFGSTRKSAVEKYIKHLY